MQFLKKPDVKVPAEQIFEECLSGYKGRTQEQKRIYADKRQRLAGCKDAVKNDSQKYREGISLGRVQQSELPPDVKREELAQVYADTFVPKNKPGRSYYEQLLSTTPYGRCPICGAKDAELQLDHYLPKSIFPTQCVTPDNLIPICPTCNSYKRDYYNLASDMRPFHMYLDRYPRKKPGAANNDSHIFLKAEIDTDFHVTYHVQCPKEWDADMCSRINRHMELYHLKSRYEEKSKNELTEICCEWQHMAANIDDELAPEDRLQVEIQTLQYILHYRRLNTRLRPNGWEAALYRAMEEKTEKILLWFKEHQDIYEQAAYAYQFEDPDDE